MNAVEPRSDADLAEISDHLHTYEPGEILFRTGEASEFTYLIREGEVELRSGGAKARFGRGTVFGEVHVVPDAAHLETAVAVSDVTVIRLRRAQLEAMLLEVPAIALEYFRSVARRGATPLAGPEEDTPDVTPQLVGQLLLLLDPKQSPPRARTTLRDLAEGCEIDLNTAHAALSALFERKLLYLAENDLVAPDLEALESFLD